MGKHSERHKKRSRAEKREMSEFPRQLHAGDIVESDGKKGVVFALGSDADGSLVAKGYVRVRNERGAAFDVGPLGFEQKKVRLLKRGMEGEQAVNERRDAANAARTAAAPSPKSAAARLAAP